MACWTYVLRDAKGRHYVGITADITRRVAEHDAGRTRADRGRGPFVLLYKEAFEDHGVARRRERYLKSGAGREWLRRMLADDDLGSGSGRSRRSRV